MFSEQTPVENHIVSSVLLSRSARPSMALPSPITCGVRLARGNHVALQDAGIDLGLSACPHRQASPRELLNIFHANEIGCHVITVTHDILKKLSLVGKGLDEYSLDTVKMFHEDAQKAGYQL